MKRINDAKKIFGITKLEDLNSLKKLYRDLIKQWHPDKFLDEAEKEAADLKSKAIIEAYHFLVSISPETHAKNAEAYNTLITTGYIDNWEYKGQTLKFFFNDQSVYEYFGVPNTVYKKMMNADNLMRFCRRQIFNEYTFCKSISAMEMA